MLETILTILGSSVVGSFLSYLYNKKKSAVEVEQLKQALETARKESTALELDNLRKALEMMKIEIQDVNKRYKEYIEGANARRQEQINKIGELEKKIAILTKNACYRNKCSERILFKSIKKDEESSN